VRDALRAALLHSPALREVSAIQSDPLHLWAVTREGNEITINLDSLHASVRGASQQTRERAVDQFAAATLDVASNVDRKIHAGAVDQLIPLIKSLAWFEARSTNRIVRRPVVADLNVVYAFDWPTVTNYVDRKELEGLSVPLDRVHEVAVENLRSRIPRHIATRGDGKSFLLMAGGNLEASLILLDEVWDQVAAQVRGEIVACVVARDVCLVTGTKVAGGLQSLVEARDRLCAEGLPAHFISTTLICRSGLEWIEFSSGQS
jgi:uncharacterized protein YtpQ (UPF0354 family)